METIQRLSAASHTLSRAVARFCFRGWAMLLTTSTGLTAPSAQDGKVMHNGADPSNLQHVSGEVQEHAMGSLHAARVALSDRQEERTSDFRTRVLGRTRNSGCNWVIQGYASTAEARDFGKQHGFKVSVRSNTEGSRRPRCRNLRARGAPHTKFS